MNKDLVYNVLKIQIEHLYYYQIININVLVMKDFMIIKRINSVFNVILHARHVWLEVLYVIVFHVIVKYNLDHFKIHYVFV